MLEKLKNLINPKAWVENVIFKKVIQKGVKAAVGIIVGLASSPTFSTHIEPIINKLLSAFDISLTQNQLENGLTILIGGGFASLWNWLAHGPLKNINLPDAPKQ